LPATRRGRGAPLRLSARPPGRRGAQVAAVQLSLGPGAAPRARSARRAGRRAQASPSGTRWALPAGRAF